MIANNQDSHDQEESMRENLEQIEDPDAEESLSFCDLPIYDKSEASTTTTTTTNWDGNDDDDPRRMSTDQELFEFLSDLKADICPADDIIFCGKLISYKEKECHHEEDKNPNLDVFAYDYDDDDDNGNQTCTIKSFFCLRQRQRRSESLRSQSHAKDRLMRINYHQLQRVSSSTKTPVEPIDRYMAGKCSGKANSSSLPTSTTPARPSWPLLMFGMVNVPKEMQLKDIRNRQNRRNPTLLPEFISGGDREKVSVRREKEKGSWRLRRALSCRGHGSAAVTAS
ncbi:uncharacterized protein LOC122066509 [Macadamia integrifolia]|uniref:uncharacterized protein LOC122066509 n=1 Tax=Macadamia integrifolia TaxID=60698 RepID=UPI001C4EFB67|nr:uncharacterized protein LOC122066509 [Macadamia integrifolia]